MSFEQDLKETFMRHADEVRPDTDSWPVIEKKVLRSNYARAVAGSASLIAVIVAAVLISPHLIDHKSKGFSKPGPLPATSSPAVAPNTAVSLHVGADQSFQIAVPRAWVAGWFEGVYEYRPAGLPSLVQGGDTFAISVRLVSGSFQRSGISGAEDPTQPTSINGHSALYAEYVDSGTGGHDAVYQIQWFTCMSAILECSSNFQDNTLVVIVKGDTDALWSKYWPEAQRAVGSLDVYDGTKPAHLLPNYQDPKSDNLFAILARFLDARVEGVNAEVFMSEKAQAAFSKSSNCLDLYQQRETHKRWTSYEIVNRIDQRSGEAKFLVMMHLDPNNGGYIESLIVGPGNVNGTTVPASIASADYSCNLGAD
jgi:hypothetical protein